jgi:hypothetical protein
MALEQPYATRVPIIAVTFNPPTPSPIQHNSRTSLLESFLLCDSFKRIMRRTDFCIIRDLKGGNSCVLLAEQCVPQGELKAIKYLLILVAKVKYRFLPLSYGLLQRAILMMALTGTLSLLGCAQAAVSITPADAFANPALTSVSFSGQAQTNSLTDAPSSLPNASPTPNITLTSEPERNQFLDETDTVLVVCFSAVLVSVSIMIAVIEFNQTKCRKPRL